MTHTHTHLLPSLPLHTHLLLLPSLPLLRTLLASEVMFRRVKHLIEFGFGINRIHKLHKQQHTHTFFLIIMAMKLLGPVTHK